MCVVLLSMKRGFVREMKKYENVQQGESSFKILRIREEGSPSVWLGSLYIEPSYVTRLELS